MRLLFALFALLLASCAAPVPERRIALTYDDAPLGNGPVFTGAERTTSLIRQLEEADTGPVAVFVSTNGTDTPEGAERIRAYADAGHLIANHSDTHPWASQTETSDYIADIDAAEGKLDALGISEGVRRPWFRFPFLDEGGRSNGSWTGGEERRDALRAALAERGLISGYVTVDTYDWHLDRLWQRAVRDGREVDRDALAALYAAMVVDAAKHHDALALEALGRRPAHVLLLHENDLAANFTVDAVRALREAGWTVIHPDEAFADPIADMAPQTLFSGGGRTAALAVDGDPDLLGNGRLDHWSASESGIEARAKAEGVFGP